MDDDTRSNEVNGVICMFNVKRTTKYETSNGMEIQK